MKPAYNIWDLRREARRRLPRAIFEFIERGCEDDVAYAHNSAALGRVKLVPHLLCDVSQRDRSVELFGRTLKSPLIIGPTGTADLLCHHGERAIAAAAGKAGIPFTLATSSTTPVEDIARVATSGLWMQLYLWDRRDLSWLVMERAAAAGAEVLVLTVDMPVFPNREFNQRNGMANPIRANPTLAADFALHPRWMLSVLLRYALSGGLPRFANYPAEVSGAVAAGSRVRNSPSVTWADVAEIRKRWPGKLVLKGILAKTDAMAAAEAGVDGIVVSNHGGRTFDAAPAPIDVLPGIVDAVGDRLTVIWDGGVRRGSDALKAMAIGAKAAMIGRATLYGAAAGGEAGAARALEILGSEIDVAMAMLGVTRLDQLDRGFVAGIN